jgi:HEAT repeat protein
LESGRGVGDQAALAAALVDDLDFPGERRDMALAALAALGEAAGPALLEVVLHGRDTSNYVCVSAALALGTASFPVEALFLRLGFDGGDRSQRELTRRPRYLAS